jgi:hypothetical protein
MMALLLISIWQALRGKWGLAGGFIGWAVIMKPTAMWTLPLIVGLLLIRQPIMTWRWQLHQVKYFAQSFVLPVGLVFVWDAVRRTHFFRAGLGNNNPGRFIRADEVWPRAEQWLELLGKLMSYPSLMVLLGIAIVVWLAMSTRRPQRCDLIGWLMILYTVAYMGIYWLVAFNTYDRYVLLVGPLVWIAGGMAFASLLAMRRTLVVILIAGMLLIGIQPAFDAAQQATNDDDWHGIDELATTLNRDYDGRIIYDYWLGWELGWYLGEDTAVWVIYFPTAEDLADHLRTETGERYIVAPSAEQAAPWLDLLERRGAKTQLVYQTTTGDFVLYSILPPRSVLAEVFG